MSGLPSSAAVVVVGGGVIGASTAFHLAEAGVRDVVLLERDGLASGSTSRAAGGVRAQFSDELNIAIALRSLDAFAAFATRPGGEIDLRQVGYLFLLDRAADVAAFERSVALQNSLGVPSRMIDVAEAERLCPLAGTNGVLAATYCPIDGHASPEAVVQGYAVAARAHGAHVETDCALTAIEVDGGEIVAVETARGRIEVSTVVCAAGVWSRPVAAFAGVELPVDPVKRQIWFTGPVSDLPDEIPFTVDFTSGLYFHRSGPGLLFGMADRNQPPGFDAELDPARLERVSEVAERRVPRLAELGIQGGWTGYYEVTPDHNALIGETPDVSRFLYATGFSGHGFLQGPAVGEIMRDLVLERAPFVDVAPLSAERFAGTAMRPEYNVI